LKELEQKIKEEAINKLKEIINENDGPEDAHIEADAVLMNLLSKLGYEEVVDLYNSIEKYYV
jgi:hypothetical protein